MKSKSDGRGTAVGRDGLWEMRGYGLGTAVCKKQKWWKGNGRFRVNFWAIASAVASSVSPLRRKALTVSFRQVGQGVGQASRLTRRQADAGAIPRTACYLVIGKGVGNPRQRR